MHLWGNYIFHSAIFHVHVLNYTLHAGMHGLMVDLKHHTCLRGLSYCDIFLNVSVVMLVQSRQDDKVCRRYTKPESCQ